MMSLFLFSDELKALVSSVRAGESAQVMAPRGVGLSTLLGALVRQLEREDFYVLAVRGTPTTSSLNYFCLQQALSGVIDTPAAHSIVGVIDAISAQFAQKPRSAIIVDGIEHVDKASLTVIQACAQRTGTPVVYGRARDVRSLIQSGAPSLRLCGSRLDLKPLDYIGTAALAQDYLGGLCDSEVVSRVFMKSAGLTDLALTVLSGARAERRVTLVDGRWMMTERTLWSGQIESWVETQLLTLTTEEHDALEHISLRDFDHLGTSCGAVSTELLRRLHGLGLLSLVNHEGTRRLAPHPPVIIDYFRRSSGSELSRREPLACGELAEPHPGRDEKRSYEGLALVVSSFREQLAAFTLRASRDWERSPSVRTAIPYLRRLLDMPRTERTVRHVLDATDIESASSADEAFDLAFLQMLALDNSLGDGSAGAVFEAVVRSYPEWSEPISHFLRCIRGHVTSSDLRFDATKVTRWGPQPGGALVLAAYAYASLTRACVTDARRWLRAVPPSALATVERFRAFVHALTDLAVGDPRSSAATSARERELAVDRVEHDAVLLYTYTNALSLISLARWREARNVVISALAFGPPGATTAGLYRSLLHIGALVHLWFRDDTMAKILNAEALTISAPDEALPLMQHEFGEIISSLIDHNEPTASALIRRLSARLHAVGQTFASNMTLRISLMVWPERATLEMLEDQASPEQKCDLTVNELIVASFRDADEVRTHAMNLARAAKADPHFAAAVMLARARQLEGDDAPLSSAVREVAATLSDAAGVDASMAQECNGSGRRMAPRPKLSTREIQVALLAGNNSNAAIASRLTLSVRTIENHIHNALRKTGARSRQELFEVVSTSPLDSCVTSADNGAPDRRVPWKR